jgi:hypothetical protein
VYYEGTVVPPEDTSGITICLDKYVDPTSDLRIDTTDVIAADGSWNVLQLDGGTEGFYDYKTYALTSHGNSTVADITVSIVTGGSGSTGSEVNDGGGNPPAVTLQMYASLLELGSLHKGTQKTITLQLNWVGANQLSVDSITVSGKNWATLTTELPQTFYREVGNDNGTAKIDFTLSIPEDAAVGEQNIAFTFDVSASSTTATVSAPVTMTILETQFQPENTSATQQLVGLMLFLAIFAILIGAVKRKRKRPL